MMRQKRLEKSQRLESMQAFERLCIENYGFYVHLLPLEDNGKCNYHTHGFWESFGHLDFQIVLPIDDQIAGSFFHMLADEVKSGKKFEEGVEYFGLTANPNMPMVFKEVSETNRMVLRMLIPDRNGIIPGKEGCDPDFDVQWR